MPIPSIPPDVTEAGAVTSPRQLQRWLDVNKLSPLTRAQTYFSVPAFTINATWCGYSELVGVFNYVASKNFSIKLNQTILPSSPNYTACIVWEDSTYTTHRYKLCSGAGELFLFGLSQYDRQLIKKNFRIEIWNCEPQISPRQLIISGAGSAVVNDTYVWNSGVSRFYGNVSGSFIERRSTYWNLQHGVDQFYRNDNLNNANDYYPLGLWTVGSGGGIAPFPTTTVTQTATQAVAFNVFTTVLQGYDYRYAGDTICAPTPAILTGLSNVLPLILPAVFPANSTPTLN